MKSYHFVILLCAATPSPYASVTPKAKSAIRSTPKSASTFEETSQGEMESTIKYYAEKCMLFYHGSARNIWERNAEFKPYDKEKILAQDHETPKVQALVNKEHTNFHLFKVLSLPVESTHKKNMLKTLWELLDVMMIVVFFRKPLAAVNVQQLVELTWNVSHNIFIYYLLYNTILFRMLSIP